MEDKEQEEVDEVEDKEVDDEKEDEDEEVKAEEMVEVEEVKEEAEVVVVEKKEEVKEVDGEKEDEDEEEMKEVEKEEEEVRKEVLEEELEGPPPTVTSLQAEAGGDGVDHNEADNVATVVLDEAFELLDLLSEQVPLILLTFGIHVHVRSSDAQSRMSLKELQGKEKPLSCSLVHQSVICRHPLFSSADVLPLRLVEAAGKNKINRLNSGHISWPR